MTAPEQRMTDRRGGAVRGRATAATVAILALAACGTGSDGGADERSAVSTSTTRAATGPTGPTATTSTSAPAGATGALAPASTTTTVRPAAGCTVGTTTARYRSLPGVEARFTSLDVHNPRGACGLPVWVWVHGGGYRIGDKANQMADKVRLAAERGWLLVSVNYRLTDPADPTAARFPDHYDDVAAAVAWIRSNIAPFGGDANRIALFGHSAGADIVSNVAVVPAHLAAHGLTTAVVDCVGPLDTAGFDKPAALATGTAGAEREEAMWEAALGNDPDWRMSTSATLGIDPARRVPPMLVTVRGAPARRAIAEGLATAVRATGAEAVVVEARGLTHNEVNSRIGAAGDTVMTPPIVGFLDRCFVG